MRIRKYTGKDMQEALAKVRSDLGVEAVILNSRKVKRRGVVAWFSKPYFEVLAAVDENFIPTPPVRSRQQGSGAYPGRASTNVQTAQPQAKVATPGPTRYGAAAYTPAREASAILRESSMPAGESSAIVQPFPAMPAGTKAMDVPMLEQANGDLAQLKQQVQSMANLLEKLQHKAEPPALGNPAETAPQGIAENGNFPVEEIRGPAEKMPERFADMWQNRASVEQVSDRFASMLQKLQDQDVERALAERIVDKVRSMLPQEAAEEEIRRQTGRVLTAALGEPETIRLRKDGKPCVAAFIGPTGVGKTTTLAKIAADFSLAQGKKVGLITADTYRIAAVEQLKTYAEILNLPVTVVYAPSDMPEAIRAHQDKDLILIDTAGRSHRNRQQFEELRQLLSAVPMDEVFLVLSVNTGRVACQEVLEHYAFVQNYKLLFTKLDETPVPGIIFNARLRTGRPLSYVTAGQSVPDDLAIADPGAIVAAAVGSRNERSAGT